MVAKALSKNVQAFRSTFTFLTKPDRVGPVDNRPFSRIVLPKFYPKPYKICFTAYQTTKLIKKNGKEKERNLRQYTSALAAIS